VFPIEFRQPDNERWKMLKSSSWLIGLMDEFKLS